MAELFLYLKKGGYLPDQFPSIKTPTYPHPHHFFVMASFKISASSFSSIYIFLSRAFYASSFFMRAIIEASMPPYLARHL